MNAPSITRMLLIAGLGLSQPALSAQGQPQAPAAPTTPKAPAIRVPDALVNPITPDETSEPAPTSETPAQPFDPAAYRAAVKRANAAVAQQDWPDAAKSLEEVLALKPDSKEAAYNLGVARFQQGDFAGARKMFQQSAQNAPADLAARSMYNEGNSIYADAVRNLPPIDPASKQGQPQQASTVPPEELQKAVQQVEQAFTHFKDAAAANPGDEDSAANAETSLKLLKELRKIQQQQQQQQQQQNKQQQDQQQDSKDQQQKQDQQQQNKQQNQDSKQDDSKQQPESQQSQSDSKSQQGDQQQQQQKQDQQQADSKNDQKPESKQDDSQQKDKRPETKPDPKQESDSKDQQKQDQQKQDQQQDQQQQNKQQPQQQQNKQPQQQSQQQAQASNDPDAKQGDAQAAEASEDRMDQTQADRLLQLVRDKEKSRNAQRKAEQARTRPTPVDRDW